MSDGDDYMKFMIQKYRLAVSVAVLKIKPKNITMEEHIRNLRSKFNVSVNSNDNVMVCEEDFNLSDDDGNASNNSVDILQSFDFNKVGEIEKSTDEMVVSNSNNEAVNQKKISNIDTSQSTFCETPNSQTYLMSINENSNDITFYESLSQNGEVNLEKDITGNLNKTINPILNPQNSNVYGVTEKYTHITQSQDNCIISSRYLLSKSDACKFNEEIFSSTDSIPLSCIKEKLNENSLLNRITSNIEKNTDSGDSLKKQKSNKIYEKVFSSDDNIPLCYIKEKNNKNSLLKINYNKPEGEVVDNDNSEKNQNGNKIQEKTFCSNDNISLKHISDNMNNSPLANKIINKVDKIVFNDNSVTSPKRNILSDVTFSIEDNVSMSYRKENINENSLSDGVTNYVETVVNDNIQLKCLKDNINNNIHLNSINENINKSHLASRVTNNIKAVVTNNSEANQNGSKIYKNTSYCNDNVSLGFRNMNVNKNCLENRVAKNLEKTVVPPYINVETSCSDDRTSLPNTKDIMNRNSLADKITNNYEAVVNNNSKRKQNEKTIHEETFCRNNNVSIGNRAVYNLKETVVHVNSERNLNGNKINSETFIGYENAQLNCFNDNQNNNVSLNYINKNNLANKFTNNFEERKQNGNKIHMETVCSNGNLSLQRHIEEDINYTPVNKVSSYIETVVNKNSERKQKRSTSHETFNNDNTSVSYVNKNVNKDYLENKITSNLVATEVDDNSQRKQRKLQKLNNHNVTNSETENIPDDYEFNIDLFSNSNTSIENKTPQNSVNYNDLSSLNNNTALNSSQFTLDMSLTDSFHSYNEGIKRNIVRSKDLMPFSQNSFSLDEHEYISQPSLDFKFITLSNKSNADTNFTLTNKSINESFKNSQEILDTNMAEPNINLSIEIDNLSNTTTENKRKVFIKEKFADITESQVEIVTFKVLEELNKVKNYLNKRERSSDGSDSKYKGSFLSGKLIDKLHEEEQYPNFMEKALEAVNDLLNYIYTGDNCEELILLKKEQAINRFFLLNKSSHIIQYSIQKITKVLHETLENIKLDDFELKHTDKAENVCYIFNILEVLLTRHAEIRKSLSQSSSQTSKDDRILKKSVLTEMWREKWNLCKSEVCEGSSQNNNFLNECSEVLNKITVEAMDGYSLVAFAALQCYNLLHN